MYGAADLCRLPNFIMTLRLSHASLLAPRRLRRPGLTLALPASTEQAIRAVAVVDTTAEVDGEERPVPPAAPVLVALRADAAPAQPAQLARAVEAYANAQDDLRSFAVGRYLRVQA